MAVGAGVRVAVMLAVGVPAAAMDTRRRKAATMRCSCVGSAAAAGGLAEEHYRTLRLRPGATRGQVKKAFRRLTLMYHPDVCKESDGGAQFQRINVAYQMVMSDMRDAKERLQHWRLKYGLANEDLDRYRHRLNEHDDDWFDL